MAPRRPKKRVHRMDAAIDNFTPMGYTRADIRTVVKKLLEVYGGDDGWPFLEADSYRVVQDALFEKQEEEEQLQLQPLKEEDEQEQEDQQPQQLEGAMEEAQFESNMSIVEVHEIPGEAEPTTEEANPMLVDQTATVIGGARRPCYGWLTVDESESDTDEQNLHVPSQESLPCKRKI